MNFNFSLQGTIKIIFKPIKFWERVKYEQTSVRLIRNSYFIPLAALVAISAFFGSLLYTNSELSASYSLLYSINCLLVIFIAVYATSWILSEIRYPMDLGKDFNTSFKLVVFSVTPFLMCQILSRLFESLLFVNIIGLYGLYIFWTGAENLLNPPRYKKMPLVIATALTFAGIYIATNFLLSLITERFFHIFFS